MTIKPLNEVTPEEAETLLNQFFQEHLDDDSLNFYQEVKMAMLQYKTNKNKYENHVDGPLGGALYDAQQAFGRAQWLAIPDHCAEHADIWMDDYRREMGL